MTTNATSTSDAGQNSARPRNEIILDPAGNTYIGELAQRFAYPNGLRLPHTFNLGEADRFHVFEVSESDEVIHRAAQSTRALAETYMADNRVCVYRRGTLEDDAMFWKLRFEAAELEGANANGERDALKTRCDELLAARLQAIAERDKLRAALKQVAGFLDAWSGELHATKANREAAFANEAAFARAALAESSKKFLHTIA